MLSIKKIGLYHDAWLCAGPLITEPSLKSIYLDLKTIYQLSIVSHDCNNNTWATEAIRSLQF